MTEAKPTLGNAGKLPVSLSVVLQLSTVRWRFFRPVCNESKLPCANVAVPPQGSRAGWGKSSPSPTSRAVHAGEPPPPASLSAPGEPRASQQGPREPLKGQRLGRRPPTAGGTSPAWGRALGARGPHLQPPQGCAEAPRSPAVCALSETLHGPPLCPSRDLSRARRPCWPG